MFCSIYLCYIQEMSALDDFCSISIVIMFIEQLTFEKLSIALFIFTRCIAKEQHISKRNILLLLRTKLA